MNEYIINYIDGSLNIIEADSLRDTTHFVEFVVYPEDPKDTSMPKVIYMASVRHIRSIKINRR